VVPPRPTCRSAGPDQMLGVAAGRSRTGATLHDRMRVEPSVASACRTFNVEMKVYLSERE